MDELLATPRGSYRLTLVERVAAGTECLVTISLEQSAGVEKFAFRCRLEQVLGDASAAQLRALLRPWLEKNFEQVREAALKSIRTERRLAELEPNPAH